MREEQHEEFGAPAGIFGDSGAPAGIFGDSRTPPEEDSRPGSAHGMEPAGQLPTGGGLSATQVYIYIYIYIYI